MIRYLGEEEKDGTRNYVEVSETGSLKRCAGQGDILIGILCTFISRLKSKDMQNLVATAAVCCKLLRKTSKKSSDQKGMSLIAGDIIENIGSVIQECGLDVLPRNK